MRWSFTLVLVFLASASAVQAQDLLDPTQALRGLRGVTLHVAEPDSALVDHGMTAGVIRAPVELLLRENEIPVLNSGDAGSYEGNPVLYVAVAGVLDDAMAQYAYQVTVELTQEVLLQRKPSIVVTDGTTWRAGGIALSGPHWRDSLLEDVTFYVASFVEDYLAANGHQ